MSNNSCHSASAPQEAPARDRRHHVVAFALPGVVAFDLSTAAQVFGYRGESEYSFETASVRGGEVATSTGFSIGGTSGISALAEADTILVPGFDARMDAGDAEWEVVRGAVARAHESGTRLVSICTGAFALAAAGVLDGRRATTHWQFAEELGRRYPRIEVDPDALFVDHGDVATSAGVAAGIDLCLHLVRQDLGHGVAMRIAKRMVVAMHREGGQAQFIERPAPRSTGDLATVIAWILGHLDAPLGVAECAERAGMSQRHFHRRFVAELGMPPAMWINRQRVSVAKTLLEGGGETMDTVARRSGLGSAANLRRHMLAEAGTTPTAYRYAFRAARVETPPRA